jgi:hypothetical protein
MTNINEVIENAWLKYRRHYDIDKGRTPKGWLMNVKTFHDFLRADYVDSAAMQKKGFYGFMFSANSRPRLFGWEIYPAYDISQNEIFIIQND